MPDDKEHKIERKRHFHAFEVYRDLGYGRTFREVSRQVEASTVSVSKWSRWFNWEERIRKGDVVKADKEATGNLLKIDDPIAEKLVTMMNRMEALIGSAFITDQYTGKLTPDGLKVTNVNELTAFVSEYRKYLETYHKFVAEYMPAIKRRDRSTNIKALNVNMGNIAQDDRINILKGIIYGADQGGDKRPEGSVQDGDFTEVSGRGDEDGQGCDGVPGSPTGSDSGDEEAVRES